MFAFVYQKRISSCYGMKLCWCVRTATHKVPDSYMYPLLWNILEVYFLSIIFICLCTYNVKSERVNADNHVKHAQKISRFLSSSGLPIYRERKPYKIAYHRKVICRRVDGCLPVIWVWLHENFGSIPMWVQTMFYSWTFSECKTIENSGRHHASANIQ